MWRQFHLGNNLATHIKENTDFVREKPWQFAECRGKFGKLYSDKITQLTQPCFLRIDIKSLNSLFATNIFLTEWQFWKKKLFWQKVLTKFSQKPHFSCRNNTYLATKLNISENVSIPVLKLSKMQFQFLLETFLKKSCFGLYQLKIRYLSWTNRN